MLTKATQTHICLFFTLWYFQKHLWYYSLFNVLPIRFICLFVSFSKSCQLWYCIQEMLKRHPLKLKILGGEVILSVEASSSDLHWRKTQCRMGWNSKSQSNQSMFWFHTFPSFTVLLSTASIMLQIAWTLMALSQSTEIFFCGEPTQKLNDRNSLKKWSKKKNQRMSNMRNVTLSFFIFNQDIV